MKVKLYTSTGVFVVEIETPVWKKWPDGIQWGERTFFLTPDQGGVILTDRNSDGQETPSYFEGLLWWYIEPR